MHKRKSKRGTALDAYLVSMKIYAVSLFTVEHRKISDDVLSDLDRITHDQLFVFLGDQQIDRWIEINNQLGFRGMQDAGGFQLKLQAASEGNDPEFAEQLRGLTPDEKGKLSFCLNVWNKAFYSFVGRISNLETLQVLLKCFEHARITSLANFIGESATVSLLTDASGEIGMISDMIRQKISDASQSKLQHGGVLVEGTLLTTLTHIQWQSILSELSEWGYIKTSSDFGIDEIVPWLDYAFSFAHEKSLKSGSKVILNWPNISSLAELLFKFIDLDAIIYDSNDYTKIYQWIDRTIVFRGKGNSDSLRTIFRTYKDRKMSCFEVLRDDNGKFSFKVLVPARQYKS